MTETIEHVAAHVDQQQLAKELVERARAEGVELVAPNGLLAGLTKSVLETALDTEMSEHLGYAKHDPAGRNHGNSRNGTRPKTVLTETGPVRNEVARLRFQARRSSLTVRSSNCSEVSPGKVHSRTGIPSRVTANPITTCSESPQ